MFTKAYTGPYPEPNYFFGIHLALSSHLCIDFPSHPFSLGFPTNIFYALPFSLMLAVCPANLMHLDLIIK
jgi:hypothetical protein